MDAEMKEAIDACTAAVTAMERGEGSAEEVCIKTRSLFAVWRIATGTYLSLLTDDLLGNIEALLTRARDLMTAAADRSGTKQDRDRAGRIDARLAEFRKVIAVGTSHRVVAS